MKLVYKYIYFEKVALGGVYYAMNNKRSEEPLGSVYWYEQWKQFVVEPLEGCVFNTQCLRDIADFLQQLNKAKKAEATSAL